MNRTRVNPAPRSDVDTVRHLLAAYDPAAGTRPDPAHRELSRIEVIASGGGRRRVRGLLPARPGLRLALGAAAVLAAAAVAVPLGWGGAQPAYAGPPPAPLEVPMAGLSEGRERLSALAEAAGEQPPPPRDGEVAYVRTLEWTFTYSQDADTGEEGWGVVPTSEQVWRTPHESGRSVSTPSAPEHQGGDPGPLAWLFERGPEEFEWGGGKGGDGMFFTWEPGDLATDPDRLAEQLTEGAGAEFPSTAAALFYALQELYGEAPVDPGVQAAALRALAGHEEVLYAGEARDREGREGELFLVEEDDGAGNVLERRIMFDSDTGMPLYHETVAVESAAEPDGELPRVNQYTVLAEAAWVPRVGDTPPVD
ncbi:MULTISPECIES: CU044_5270 family protein [unclassified Nocardiopsis]|uniref:CU044_5270 family protein n=1 Tax=unclassified Nocardiopsis TaxID=2649073 RepID=UPI00135B2322|nr:MULTISPECIES: CU044_5270 family protein [unclassified Nocardiopsis]